MGGGCNKGKGIGERENRNYLHYLVYAVQAVHVDSSKTLYRNLRQNHRERILLPRRDRCAIMSPVQRIPSQPGIQVPGTPFLVWPRSNKRDHSSSSDRNLENRQDDKAISGLNSGEEAMLLYGYGHLEEQRRSLSQRGERRELSLSRVFPQQPKPITL